jgi:hypothetical protein
MSNSNRCLPNFKPVNGIEYVLSDFNEQQLARKCKGNIGYVETVFSN